MSVIISLEQFQQFQKYLGMEIFPGEFPSTNKCAQVQNKAQQVPEGTAVPNRMVAQSVPNLDKVEDGKPVESTVYTHKLPAGATFINATVEQINDFFEKTQGHKEQPACDRQVSPNQPSLSSAVSPPLSLNSSGALVLKKTNQKPPLGSDCPTFSDKFYDPAPAKRVTPDKQVEDLSPPSEKACGVRNFAVTSTTGEGPVTLDQPL